MSQQRPTAPTEKVRYPLELGLIVANSLLAFLEPFCERIEIAGSIRRGRQDVGDVELVCIPKTEPAPADLFGQPLGAPRDLLDHQIRNMIQHGLLGFRLSKAGNHQYGPKNKLLVHQGTGMPVDVFSADEKNWGMTMLVRTGPAAWNIRVMSRFRELDMEGHAYGGVTRDGVEVPCPTEESVFDLLQWHYVVPEYRK